MARSASAHHALTRGDGLAVDDARLGGDHDARTRHLRSPTQVQVFADERNQRVEAAQGAKQVGANQGDAAGRHEHVALEVLLSVIDLTGYHAVAHDTESVAGLTHVQQDEGIFVVDELR